MSQDREAASTQTTLLRKKRLTKSLNWKEKEGGEIKNRTAQKARDVA